MAKKSIVDSRVEGVEKSPVFVGLHGDRASILNESQGNGAPGSAIVPLSLGVPLDNREDILPQPSLCIVYCLYNKLTEGPGQITCFFRLIFTMT